MSDPAACTNCQRVIDADLVLHAPCPDADLVLHAPCPDGDLCVRCCAHLTDEGCDGVCAEAVAAHWHEDHAFRYDRVEDVA